MREGITQTHISTKLRNLKKKVGCAKENKMRERERERERESSILLNFCD